MATVSIFLLQIVSLKSQLSMEEDARKNLDERLTAKVSRSSQIHERPSFTLKVIEDKSWMT